MKQSDQSKMTETKPNHSIFRLKKNIKIKILEAVTRRGLQLGEQLDFVQISTIKVFLKIFFLNLSTTACLDPMATF
jgi:hypothetical protein